MKKKTLKAPVEFFLVEASVNGMTPCDSHACRAIPLVRIGLAGTWGGMNLERRGDELSIWPSGAPALTRGSSNGGQKASNIYFTVGMS